jgi:hypothetical protein
MPRYTSTMTSGEASAYYSDMDMVTRPKYSDPVLLPPKRTTKEKVCLGCICLTVLLACLAPLGTYLILKQLNYDH